MSNHVAIAAVTSTLVELLSAPLDDDVPGAKALPGRPDQPVGEDQALVRIFLYLVEPNAAWRNNDLPMRRADGALAQRPQVALNLHYLLTFFGDEAQLVPQRLLASAVRALHSQPLLSRQAIRRTITNAISADPDHFLAEADLADQPELVRFTPLQLDLEALSKLWSVFFQVPYHLSVAYEASVVLINPDETPGRPLPVRERRFFVVPIRRPTIVKIVRKDRPRDPVTAGAVIRILGSQLHGEITRVRLGGDVVDPQPADVQDEEIQLTLPATVRPGLNGVQVIQALLMGEPPGARTAAESNVAPLIVHPRIREAGGTFQISVLNPRVDTGGLHSGDLRVELDLPVGKTQRVVLHLSRLSPAAGPPESYSFPDPPRDVSGAPATTSILEIPFVRVAAGTYLVRLQIDGAESLMVIDPVETSPTFGQYVRPSVTMP